MMIPERPALERRVLEALDDRRRQRDRAAGRIPVVLGGCGTGRTSLLLRLRDLLGRNAAQYLDVERIATTPERFLSRCASRRRSRAVAARAGNGRARAARGVRRVAGVPRQRARHRPAGRRRSCSTSSSSCGRSRASRACARVLRDLVAALASSANRFVLTSALRRAGAPAAARRAGAVRDHATSRR